MSRNRRFSAFSRDRRGATAVEFALISPVLILLIAGAVDLGGELYTKFQLDCAVNAGIGYAMANAGSVSSSGGAGLASTMAALVANAQGTSSANSAITVNNGPTASAGASSGSGGTASAADSCYCPSGTAPAVTWGAATTCGGACSSGGYAGKFVLVQASASYAPIFTGYGFVKAGQITSSSIVRVQ